MIEFFVIQHGAGLLITVIVAIGIAIWFRNMGGTDG